MKLKKAIATKRLAMIVVGLLIVVKSPAATHYLVPTNLLDASPYTSWETAGTSVIDVVNAAMSDVSTPRTVLVSNGVYVLTNSVVITNDVTVQSINGRDVTVWDGNASNGFTNHVWLRSGGIVLNGLTITNCLGIGGYTAQLDGGGLNIYGGLVTNCLITGCRMTGGGYSGGGGILISGTGVVANCIIRGNRSSSGGGGIYIGGWNGQFKGRSVGTVQNCIIEDNIVDNNQSGAGILLYRPLPGIVRNCLIRNNAATNAACYGGGIMINEGTNVMIANCTIVSNSCLESGGGICYISTHNVTNIVVNCIISSNAARTFNKNIADINAVNKYVVGYSCSTSNTYFIVDERGNKTNDPAFMGFEQGNYRFNRSSPCFNSGTNQLDWMTNSVDLDGHARILHGRVDMGAYELFIPSGMMFSFK